MISQLVTAFELLSNLLSKLLDRLNGKREEAGSAENLKDRILIKRAAAMLARKHKNNDRLNTIALATAELVAYQRSKDAAIRKV